LAVIVLDLNSIMKEITDVAEFGFSSGANAVGWTNINFSTAVIPIVGCKQKTQFPIQSL
jgi:hypothetical protein